MFSRPSPHHPTYAYMIRCAIEALGEGSGSTVQSISDYVKAKFHGLPLGHNRLIVFYLNQLIEIGEFAVGGAPDRYVIVSDAPSPPAPCARYSSPESMIKCAIQTLGQEGGSTQESICSYVLAEFGELPWAPRKFLFFFVDRMLERGELVAGAEPGRYVLAPPSSGPKSPVAQEGPSKAEEERPSVPRSELKSSDGGGGGGGGGDSVSQPKRGRGRPLKKRTNASESSQPDAAQDAPRPTQPVGRPPRPNLGPNEYILALPAPANSAAAARVEVPAAANSAAAARVEVPAAANSAAAAARVEVKSRSSD